MSYPRYFRTITEETIRDFSGFGNPVVLIVLVFLFFGLSKATFMVFVGLLVVEIISNGVKLFHFKERPVKHEHGNFLEKIYAASFPSVHSARSSFFFLSLYTVLAQPVSYLALLTLFLVGVSRVVLKKHDVIDVMAGFCIGFIVSFGWMFFSIVY